MVNIAPDQSENIKTEVPPKVQEVLERVPNFIENFLVMPSNPGAITDRMIQYRLMKNKQDEEKNNLH
ncbi:MAG: hypothetical protein GY828_06110 [Candidatus Gracilibacteria bacterium]|nr:hypothetical protein [Candidatus Gracilibacteria bacterium]